MAPDNSTLEITKKNFIEDTIVSKSLLVVNILLAIVYFYILAFWFPQSSLWLYWLLIAGEIFHLWQVFTYLYTIWNTEYMPAMDSHYLPPVDVFITVAGEPVDIVEETVSAIKNMDYPYFSVYILNDGYVAKKENWREMEDLAQKLEVVCITRRTPGGAKAGNINNALRVTRSPFVAIFDADHVPHRDFLRKTVPYFYDQQLAFVQTPQFYKNYELNYVTHSSWEQQELFFGPICKGKNRLNAATMCGTNMVIRREALLDVGGMCEESIAEDFVTGLFMHAKGLKSVYVPEVLAEGLAPEDFLSYNKQQFRWARGALDVIFRYNPLFMKGLTFAQRIQYLSSASFYLSGLIVLMNAVLPIIFLYTGLVPFEISTMALALVFLPYMFVTLYMVQRSSNFSYTFHSLAFSMSGFIIHIKAILAAAFRIKSAFSVTAKKQLTGNFISMVTIHILYTIVGFIGFGFALYREGISPSVISNTAWVILNVSIFVPFIKAALPEKSKETVYMQFPKQVIAPLVNK